MFEIVMPEVLAAAQPPSAISENEFNRLYEATSGDLWRYIARMTGDATLADDIFQKTFFRFLRSNPTIESEVHVRALLFRIATNLVIDHWRQQKRERQWFSTVEPIAFRPDPGFTRDVRRLLGQMKPQQRALLWLAHAEERTHEEIAEMLGVGERSVRVLLFRARKRFAELLCKHGITPRCWDDAEETG